MIKHGIYAHYNMRIENFNVYNRFDIREIFSMSKQEESEKIIPLKLIFLYIYSIFYCTNKYKSYEPHYFSLILSVVVQTSGTNTGDAAGSVSTSPGKSTIKPVNTTTIKTGSENQGEKGTGSEGETGGKTGTGTGNKTGSGSGTGGGADAVSLNFFVFALTVFGANFIQLFEN